MLCTPPAFILSQDQTLEIIVSKHRSLCDLIFLLSSLALSFFYFLLSSILICKNFPRSVSSFSLCTSLLLFNFQWSVFCPAFARPCYYTTSSPVCQPLFWNFSKSFFGVPSRSTPLYLRSPSLGELVHYTTPPTTLSRTFFHFFPFRHFKQFFYVILYDFLVV